MKRILMFLSCVFVICVYFATSAISEVWENQIVDERGYAGEENSIAINSKSYPHIAYYASPYGGLKYAKWNGRYWETQVVVGEVDIQSISMVLDSNDFPHIGYSTRDHVKYAKWTGTDWKIQFVERNVCPSKVSIAVDKNDIPSVSYGDSKRSYGDSKNESIKYARLTSSSGWNVTIVESGSDLHNGSIAIDSNNYPRLCYSVESDDRSGFKYARWTGTKWDIQVINTEVPCKSYLSLDSHDIPHILYTFYSRYTRGTSGVNYIKYTGSQWLKEEVVKEKGISGMYFTLDSNDSPHIAYCQGSYIMYTKKDKLQWDTQIVHEGRGYLSNPSLALDSNNSPYISYYDDCYGNLMHAKTTNPPILSRVGEPTVFKESSGIFHVEFRVKYTDLDNDAPKWGYPKLHIRQPEIGMAEGVEIEGSPFVMTAVDNVPYSAGRIYTYSVTLSPGINYTYYFEARDVWSSSELTLISTEKRAFSLSKEGKINTPP